MDREEAINKLAKIKLKELSEEERVSQLETLLVENWDSVNEWKKLPKDIKEEFNSETLNEEPSSDRYDEPLLAWLRDGLKPLTNAYLLKELNVDSIEGSPAVMESCPCCGRKTIEHRGYFEICKICWWEDDGQDNENADEVWAGPNYGVSLTQARYFFIKIGIYNPAQIGLKEIQDPVDIYPVGRTFELKAGFVLEREKNWKGEIVPKI